jgi:hypothetical protein
MFLIDVEIMTVNIQKPFKICPMCGKSWPSREAFLADCSLLYNGYQPDFGLFDQGLFYFTHEQPGCGSTMVLRAEAFISLYQGPHYAESRQGKEECPGYCLDRSKLQRCEAHCRHAFVREVSQLILDREKTQVTALSG